MGVVLVKKIEHNVKDALRSKGVKYIPSKFNV